MLGINMRLIMIFALIFLCDIAIAEPIAYRSIESFISDQKNFSNNDLISSQADINEDGATDWLGVFYNKTHIQIFVLVKQKDGMFIISGSSNLSEFGGYSIGDGWINEIEKQGKDSFYLTFAVKSGYTAITSYKYIFKYKSSVWRLIGEDFEYIPIGEDDEEREASSVSINYLAGNFSKSITKNRKSKYIKGKRKYPNFLLRDFDFYNPYGMEEFWH